MTDDRAAEAAPGARGAAESDLNILDLGSILQSLAASRRTGTLRVTGRQGEQAHLYFKAGVLRSSTSEAPGMNVLEEGLLKASKLTAEELEELRGAARSSGRPLHELVIDQGKADKRELERLVVRQVVERATDLLSWRDVHCEFFPDTLLEPELSPELAGFAIGVVVDGVLLEAARRADEWERVQHSFDPIKEVFELVREVPENRSMPAERELAKLIDGYRDVSELVAASSLSSFEACTTLIEMINGGFIKARGAGQLIQMGGMASAQGDWAKALRLYQRARAMDRKRSDLPVRMAAAYEALGDVDSARGNLLEFVRESMEHSRFDEAARACERLVLIDPEEPEHRAKLFKCLSEGGRKEEMAKIGRELIGLYEKRGTLDRASEILAKLRELFPDEPDLAEIDARIRLATAERTEALIEYEKLADAYLSRGEIGDAIRTFRKILDEIDEECLEARLQLAECLIQVERIDEAVTEYTRLAEILTRTGVFEGSVNLPFVLKVQRRVAELDPNNTSSREWLAETFAARGDRAQAMTEFDELLVIYEQRGDREKLVSTLSRLEDLFPEELRYRERLAELYLDEEGGQEKAKRGLQGLIHDAGQRGDFELGARCARRLLKLDPFQMEAHVLLGEAMLAAGKLDAAVEKLLSAALMYIGAGLLEQAETVLKEVVHHEGGSVEAHRFLAAILEERGMLEEAAEHYKAAGQLSLEAFDFGTARVNLEAAQGLALNDPDIERLLGRLPAEVRER